MTVGGAAVTVPARARMVVVRSCMVIDVVVGGIARKIRNRAALQMVGTCRSCWVRVFALLLLCQVVRSWCVAGNQVAGGGTNTYSAIVALLLETHGKPFV